ncbi:hypothetical protein [Pseudovibrio sp. Tun.PSC04-5.I4]|uniref:hypothetical protein n=1 Tax=Pseudovibrio sp. Tun.PSC04-5.I4 TaxID=1798213 RepID=UPI00088F6196|nr:hypothetical protein [Pseudovibrio sp. Tun.PSC04-5.I4]SDR45240.1 hypothetical protein SAMN04515695_5529 [Pseudovibrio sp. Tun.PSC04-5.I4]
MRQGDLFQYRYLWAYQAKRGEEAGRKSRPCCLVIKVRDQLALFPCTTQEPEGRGRIYLEIPDLERKRANLDTRSFIVLDEFNIVRNVSTTLRQWHLDFKLDFLSLALVD